MTEQSTILGFGANIAPELQHLAQPIERFQPHPENARKHRKDKIRTSIMAHGQRSPIIVQASTKFIVKGNGTWAVCKELGWEEIAVVEQEMDEERARAYLLADNWTSDGVEYDMKLHIALLDKMVAGPGLLDTGYSIEDLEDLIAQANAIQDILPGFEGTFAESEEQEAQRKADAETVQAGQKRREVPLVYSLEDHALFVGWLKTLQDRWKIKGTMVTVFAAVKRQAEAEEGVGLAGAPLTEEVRVAERRAALAEFKDLLNTVGGEAFTRGWLMQQLDFAMVAQGETEPAKPAPRHAIVDTEMGDPLPEMTHTLDSDEEAMDRFTQELGFWEPDTEGEGA